MKQDLKSIPQEVVLGKTHFTYPGETELIAYSEQAIKNDERAAEFMRLTGLEMIRRAKLMPD